MKRKVLSLLLVLSMIVCIMPMTVEQAAAAVNYYTVRLDPNRYGAQVLNSAAIWTTSPSSRSLRKGDGLTQDFNKLTARCSGATFLGFYSARSGGVKITASNVKNFDGKTIYAHWADSLPSVTLDGNMGTRDIRITCTNGHSWYFYYASGSTAYFSASKVGDNYFRLLSNRTDSGTQTIYCSGYFRDNYGNIISCSVSQTPNLVRVNERIQRERERVERERERVNRTFGIDKFYNDFNQGESPSYNMGYSALFGKGIRINNNNSTLQLEGLTWCPYSAVMDLLNRRLAADNLLSNNYYFDIRDILLYFPEYCYGDITQIFVSKDPTKAIRSLVYMGNMNVSPGVPCNITSKSSSKDFYNTKGAKSGTAKHYTVTFVGVMGLPRDEKIKTLKEYIDKHPEGVFIYSNAGGDHAMVAVSYTNDSFMYIDNGSENSYNNSRIIPYDMTCFKGDHKIDNELTMIDCIYNIGYVNQ